MSAWKTKIEKKITNRVPELNSNKNKALLDDLIDDALAQIVIYENASSYNTRWDNLLVNCVVTLYNYLGNEGSISRDANGVNDTYSSSSILSELLSRNITPYIKPTGYQYPSTRFDYPQ